MTRVGWILTGISVGTLIALAYTHQQITLIQSAYAVEQRAQVKTDKLDQYHILLYNVLTLQAPQWLEQRLARRDIELVSPRRIAWVATPPASLPVAETRGAPGLLERGRRLLARVTTPRATAEAQPAP